MKHYRGFTLIELLVVIAIIGILSAVVLASLNTARSKGNDAAIKSNLDTIRTQSAIYYDNNGNAYGTNAAAAGPSYAACSTASTLFTDPNIAAAILAAYSAAGSVAANMTCYAAINSATWAVYTKLTNNTGSNTGWCVDSAGNSRNTTAPAAGVCP